MAVHLRRQLWYLLSRMCTRGLAAVATDCNLPTTTRRAKCQAPASQGGQPNSGPGPNSNGQFAHVIRGRGVVFVGDLRPIVVVGVGRGAAGNNAEFPRALHLRDARGGLRRRAASTPRLA